MPRVASLPFSVGEIDVAEARAKADLAPLGQSVWTVNSSSELAMPVTRVCAHGRLQARECFFAPSGLLSRVGMATRHTVQALSCPTAMLSGV